MKRFVPDRHSCSRGQQHESEKSSEEVKQGRGTIIQRDRPVRWNGHPVKKLLGSAKESVVRAKENVNSNRKASSSKDTKRQSATAAKS
jgi:hypothetical protein